MHGLCIILCADVCHVGSAGSLNLASTVWIDCLAIVPLFSGKICLFILLSRDLVHRVVEFVCSQETPAEQKPCIKISRRRLVRPMTLFGRLRGKMHLSVFFFFGGGYLWAFSVHCTTYAQHVVIYRKSNYFKYI